MAKKITHVDSLVVALTEYNSVCDQIKTLEQRKQEINMQIRTWFASNKIDNLFEVADLNKIITQISKRSQVRRSIVDYDILKTILEKSHNEDLIKETESETFMVKTLKKHTSDWQLVESRKYEF